MSKIQTTDRKLYNSTKDVIDIIDISTNIADTSQGGKRRKRGGGEEGICDRIASPPSLSAFATPKP